MPKHFNCKDCSKKFPLKAKLQAHLKTHLTQKNKKENQKASFRCQCKKSFTSVAAKKKHEKSCIYFHTKLIKPKQQEKMINKSIYQNHEHSEGAEGLINNAKKVKDADNAKIQETVSSEKSMCNTSNSLGDNICNLDNNNIAKNSNSVNCTTDALSEERETTVENNRPENAREISHFELTQQMHTKMHTLFEETISPVHSKDEDSDVSLKSETQESEVSTYKAETQANENVNTYIDDIITAVKASGEMAVNENVEDDNVHVIKVEETNNENLKLKLLSMASESRLFQCAVCNKSFRRKYHLDRHLRMSPCSGLPPPEFPCQVCGKVYTRKDNLRDHLRAHTQEVRRPMRYKCEYCGKEFHGMSLLKIHVRKHTGEKPFACEFCPSSFPSAGALTKHRRIHTGEKPFECPECGLRFSLKGTLNRHNRVHTGVRPHKCEYCGKQFIQIGGLKAHLFYHTGENGFHCDKCGKSFNRKARLQMHNLYVHDKVKSHHCEQCNKAFTRKEDLHRHAILHTGEKPFQCPTCNKKFAIKPSLKLHLLTHTKEEPRSCHECGRAFIRKDCLLRHMRKRHRDLLDKILSDEKDQKLISDKNVTSSRVMSEEDLRESIRELLSLLVDEPTLVGFGWPDKCVDEVLEAVIRRCGHTPVNPNEYSYMDRLRENSKLLFTVVIDDNAVKTLLNNQTVDEVIVHVLRLAKMN